MLKNIAQRGADIRVVGWELASVFKGVIKASVFMTSISMLSFPAVRKGGYPAHQFR